MATAVATAGAVPRIKAREEFVPVLRVGDLQEVAGRKHKCTLSDGSNLLRGILATQFADQVAQGIISNGALVKVNAYVINTVGNEDVLMATDLEVVAPGNAAPMEVDGTPALSTHNVAQSGTPTAAAKEGAAPSMRVPPMKENSTPPPASAFMDVLKSQGTKTPGISPMPFPTPPNTAIKTAPTPPSIGVSDRKSYHKIGALHPYDSNWCIKAKLSRKMPLRSSNIRGTEIKILGVELVDDCGQEIAGTFWRQQAERMAEVLQEGRVYVFSRFKVKPADKKYSGLKSDYAIDFTDQTEVAEAADQDTSAMQAAVEVTPIDGLGRCVGQRTLVDILGVLLQVGTLGTIKRKADGGELTRRDITIGDRSGKSVSLTLWGDNATSVSGRLEGMEGKLVMQVTGVRVTDFNGCSLSTTSKSVVTLDPPGEDAQALRLWYEMSGMAPDRFTAVGGDVQGGRASGGATGGQRDRFSTLKDVMSLTPDALPDESKPAFHGLVANVAQVFSDQSMWYLANPENGKKVVEQGERFWCEGDSKFVDKPEHRYMMSVRMVDHTGQVIVQVFNKEGEAMFGRKADEMQALKGSDPEAYERLLRGVAWRPWSCLLVTKAREYNGERRLRSTLSRLEPVDWVAEGNKLLGLIAKYDA